MSPVKSPLTEAFLNSPLATVCAAVTSMILFFVPGFSQTLPESLGMTGFFLAVLLVQARRLQPLPVRVRVHRDKERMC